MQNYTGYLLASHPLRKETNFQQGVIFTVDYTSKGVYGLQINKPMPTGLKFIDVMEKLNFSINFIDQELPVYFGGLSNTARVYILHSSEWSSSTTIKYNSHISLTSDISILSAISVNQGPKYFRAIIGTHFWNNNLLDKEMEMNDNNFNHWYYTPAKIKLVFSSDQKEQWINVLKSVGKNQINKWFN